MGFARNIETLVHYLRRGWRGTSMVVGGEVVVAILTRCDHTRAPAVSRVVAGQTHSVSPPSTMEGRSFGYMELTIRIYNEYKAYLGPDGNNCIDPS